MARNGGVRIAWRAFGRGEPVLMIMGLMGSGRAWHRLLPHVAGPPSHPRHRAVVFDNRGTGDSGRPPGLWSMDDLRDDALAVLDDSGVDAAHVVGASMGGMIAQHLALAAPERVRSLTLCCTHPGRQPGAPPWRLLASLALRPVLDPARSYALAAPLLYSERTRRERPQRIAEDLRVRTQDATPSLTAPAQLAAVLRHDTRSRLEELSMPVLILHGEEDRLIPPSAAEELARLIPHAKLVVIPEAGHLLATDAERESAGALIEFLEAHRSTKRAPALREAG